MKGLLWLLVLVYCEIVPRVLVYCETVPAHVYFMDGVALDQLVKQFRKEIRTKLVVITRQTYVVLHTLNAVKIERDGEGKT